MMGDKLNAYRDRYRIVAETLEFLHYTGREFKNPWSYINALIIGCLITLFSRTLSVSAFIIPLFVQSFAKSAVFMKNRAIETLVELPAQREDPAFIMDNRGRVVLSTGKTLRLFKRLDIKTIEDLIGLEGRQAVLENIDPGCDGASPIPADVYSDKTGKWYEVMTKPMVSYCGQRPNKHLVWFQDRTVQKEYALRQKELLHYTGNLVSGLKTFVKKGNTLETLASFILANYEAVFITRTNEKDQATGFVFKRKGRVLEKSPCIHISGTSMSPVLMSRRQSRMVSDHMGNFPDQSAFQSKYPFNKHVLAFLDVPVRNFINYHQGDVSIIVFNARKRVTIYEKQFIEVLLNLTHSVISLVDLARENDAQFLQKVMGLCAAAEYSDKITGEHILRVNEYSRFIAGKMGFDEEFVETIGQIAALHDIGKVAIPEYIKLPRVYTPEERLQMQMHTVYGADIIETMLSYAAKKDRRLEIARNIALHHHQAYDGSGYPPLKQNGVIIHPESKHYKDYQKYAPLTGSEIPIEGLIVGLADRYDALRSRRQYKEEYSHDKVLTIMSRDDRNQVSGARWYGPDIWSAFEANHKEFDLIYQKLGR